MHATNEALAIALERQPEFEKRIAHLENIVLAKDGELRLQQAAEEALQLELKNLRDLVDADLLKHTE